MSSFIIKVAKRYKETDVEFVLKCRAQVSPETLVPIRGEIRKANSGIKTYARELELNPVN